MTQESKWIRTLLSLDHKNLFLPYCPLVGRSGPISLDPVLMYGPLTAVDGARGLFVSICTVSKKSCALFPCAHQRLNNEVTHFRQGDVLPFGFHWEPETESKAEPHKHR